MFSGLSLRGKEAEFFDKTHLHLNTQINPCSPVKLVIWDISPLILLQQVRFCCLFVFFKALRTTWPITVTIAVLGSVLYGKGTSEHLTKAPFPPNTWNSYTCVRQMARTLAFQLSGIVPVGINESAEREAIMLTFKKPVTSYSIPPFHLNFCQHAMPGTLSATLS